MPTWRVTAPDGRRFKVSGDSPPSEQELEDIFAGMGPAPMRPVSSHGPATRPAADQLGGVPHPEQSLTDRLRPYGLSRIGHTVDAVKGAAAGLLSTAYHGGDLIRRATGMERVIDTPEAQAAMTPPDSAGGKLGFYGEQMAEFAAPAGAVSRATQGGGMLTRMAAEGALGGGIAAVQSGGDVGTMAFGAGAGALMVPVAAGAAGAWKAAKYAAAGAKEGGIGGAVAAAVRRGGGELAPADLMTRAIKPKATNTHFVKSLDLSLPELKAAEAQLGKPIEGLDDLMAATKVAKRTIQAQIDQMRGPAEAIGTTVDLRPVAKAIRSSIPKRTRMLDPGAVDRLEAQAAAYERAMPVQEAEQLLREANSALDGFYGKYPGAQRRALASDPAAAAMESEARTLRNVIYTALDHPGQGEAARTLNRRYGALLRLEEEGYRRLNVAARQQPESLSEQIGAVQAAGSMAKGAYKLATGDIYGAADIAAGRAMNSAARFMKEQQTTDALIRRAFKGLGDVQPAAVNIPRPAAPRALLERGAIPLGGIPPEPGLGSVRAPIMDYDAQGRPIYSSDPHAPSLVNATFAGGDAPPRPGPPNLAPEAPAIDAEVLAEQGPPRLGAAPRQLTAGPRLLGPAPEPPPVVAPEPPRTAVPEPAPAAAYKPGNPFAEKAVKARETADRLSGATSSAHDRGMAEAFPLGAGFGRGSQRAQGRRTDASVNRAVEAVGAEKRAAYLEAQARAFDEGNINAQGRAVDDASRARSDQRAAAADKRNARINEAKAQREGKERWQVRRDVYADSTGSLAGSARKLVESDHRGYVEAALAEGKPVPSEVLRDYPDLAPVAAPEPAAASAPTSKAEAMRAASAKKLKGRGVEPSPELARAVGADAGNRSAKAAGRTGWNADDYNAAAEAYAKVDPAPATVQPAAEAKPQAPATAAAEVRREMERVIDTKGAKSAAEIQRRVTAALMEELQAVKTAAASTAEVDIRYYKGRTLAVRGDTGLNIDEYGKVSTGGEIADWRNMSKERQARIARHELYKHAGETLTIRIPGDGTFTISRSPEAVEEMLKRVTKAGSSAWKDLAASATRQRPRK